MVRSSPATTTATNPAAAPELSITWPTTAAPAATPAAIPVEIHANASVSRVWSTEDWVTATEAIRVGAMAIPLSISSSARATGW